MSEVFQIIFKAKIQAVPGQSTGVRLQLAEGVEVGIGETPGGVESEFFALTTFCLSSDKTFYHVMSQYQSTIAGQDWRGGLGHGQLPKAVVDAQSNGAGGWPQLTNKVGKLPRIFVYEDGNHTPVLDSSLINLR